LILPVIFTPRHEMEWEIDESEIDEEFEQSFNDLPIEKKKEIIQRYVTRREMSELRPRVKKISEDIVDHYENIESNDWKGMVVTPTRKAAALYGKQLLKLRDQNEIKVLISSEGDEENIPPSFHTTPEERNGIIKRFKREENPKILVVCDMLLTGFDAPGLKTMYLDRNLKNHNLLQAIARTNRPRENKNNGEIVDYQGVFNNLDEALQYDREVQNYSAMNREVLFEGNEEVGEVEAFLPLLNKLMGIFDGIKKEDNPEVLNKCVTRLQKNPELRKEFKQNFKKLRDIYETLLPDPRLSEKEIQNKYTWLNQVYLAFKEETGTSTDIRRDYGSHTKKIIEKHVDVKEIKDNFKQYKLSKEHLEEIEDLEPSVKATKIIHASQSHLHPRTSKNPKYQKLSDRLNEIIEEWQSGSIDDPEAVEVLEEIEREAIEVKEGPERMNMSEAEYALYLSLKEEFDEYIEDDQEAKNIAEAIWRGFEEGIHTDFPNWKNNERTVREIKKMIVKTVVIDMGKRGLYDTDFKQKAFEYIVENQ